MKREDILSYLSSIRRSDDIDPLHKWIGTYNLHIGNLTRFFKWLYNPTVEPGQRPKAKLLYNIPKLKREDMLKKSFQEISRVLKVNGACYIVYAHKSTAGWETLINSLLDSGLTVTAAWPINTEKEERLRATESAALASSIYMVAGKYNKKSIGFYRDIKADLRKHLNNELDKLWIEGISGADFFISGIGSSIEVFGMYEKIIDDEGNEIRADKILKDIRGIVTDYTVKRVLHNGFVAEISQMTRLYLLWRWA